MTSLNLVKILGFLSSCQWFLSSHKQLSNSFWHDKHSCDSHFSHLYQSTEYKYKFEMQDSHL